MRKVFLDNLPKHEIGRHIGKIDWKQSVGKEVPFIYGKLSGSFKIIDFDLKTRKVTTDYEGYRYSVYAHGITNCELSGILNKKRITGWKYKYEVGQIVKDVEILDQDFDFERQQITNSGYFKKYKYKCNICGNIDWCNEESIDVNKCVCNVCSGNKVLEGVNDIPTTAPWMVDYFQGGYDEARRYNMWSHTYKYFVCPDCGRVRNKKIPIKILYAKKSIGCSCKDGYSYPNKFMLELLKQLNIEFETEYSPQWISPRRYDFYIPSKNLIIEMDGNLGHGYTAFGKDRFNPEELDRCIKIDKLKDEMAIQHGLAVERIDCRISNMEYIRDNIIKANIFTDKEIENISFEKCAEYAVNNLVKMVCDSYEKENITNTKVLAEKYNIARTTAINYLHQGKEFGWCSYDSKQSMSKNGITNGIRNGKTVFVKQDGKTIKKYYSIAECSRKSEEDFGIRFPFGAIRDCLSGKREEYKGYSFKNVV